MDAEIGSYQQDDDPVRESPVVAAARPAGRDQPVATDAAAR